MPSAEPTPARPRRVPFWDNARWLLLLLVVWGHLLNDLPIPSRWQHWVTLLIYAVHIPALIFISGWFASTDLRKIVRSVWRLLVAWLIFEAIWAVLRLLVFGDAPGSSFLVIPSWTLWFLVSLACMMMLLPLLAATRAPLAIAVLLALAAGMLTPIGADWSLSRTLYFLPAFVLGWQARRKGWLDGDWFQKPRPALRAGAVAVLAALAAFAWLYLDAAEQVRARTWVAGYLPYQALLDPIGVDSWWGIVVRGCLLVLSAAMVLCGFLLVPRRSTFFTGWGSRTLYIYLLHTFIVFAVVRMGWFAALSADSPRLTIVVTGVLAFVISVILSTRFVATVFRPVVEPSMRWLLVPSSSGSPIAPPVTDDRPTRQPEPTRAS